MDLSASLTEEQENYDKLYTKLVAAKNNYTTKSIEAEKTLKEAELSAKNASSQYSVDVSGADNDITDAKDTLSDAEEALEEFEAAIGDDGTIYAEYTGTITDLSYEAGDTISSGATVATFSNTDAVTITVSVSEEDITNIAVGDVVEIELSAYEDQTFAGEVESIDTSSSSGSSTDRRVYRGHHRNIHGHDRKRHIYQQAGDGCAVCIQQGGPVGRNDILCQSEGCGRNDPHGGCGDGIF